MLKHYATKKIVHIYAYTIAYIQLHTVYSRRLLFRMTSGSICCLPRTKKFWPLQSPATEKQRVRQAYHELRLDEIDVDDLEDAGFTPGGCETPGFKVVIED